MSKGLEQCDKCDYYISVEEAYQEAYNQALEDFFNKCLEEYIEFYLNPVECLREVKEQLKQLRNS